jgi:hypothetical protein
MFLIKVYKNIAGSFSKHYQCNKLFTMMFSSIQSDKSELMDKNKRIGKMQKIILVDYFFAIAFIPAELKK